MKNILAKDLKIKFVETLNVVESFSYEEGNPFLITINSKQFFIFLKNLSPAYFKKSPDVTRVQLPYSEHFSKIFKANIPFVIVGYDVDNDTFVTWNPQKIKERLNAKRNVSLYSRESFQSNINANEFRTGFLKNGDKIVVFQRESLHSFFDKLDPLFHEIHAPKLSNLETNILREESSDGKLREIIEPTLLALIEPLLRNNKVLQSVEICSDFYKEVYQNMTFKDWFTLVNDQYQKLK